MKRRIIKKSPVQVTQVTQESKTPSIKLSMDSIYALLEEKAGIDEKIKILSERKSEIAEQLKSLAEERGSRDDKGSFNFIFELPDGQKAIIQKQRRVSPSINQAELKAILKKSHRDLYKLIFKTEEVEVLNEEALVNAIVSGALTSAEVKKFKTEKETWAGVYKVLAEEEQEKIEETAPVQITPKVTTAKSMLRRRR